MAVTVIEYVVTDTTRRPFLSARFVEAVVFAIRHMATSVARALTSATSPSADVRGPR